MDIVIFSSSSVSGLLAPSTLALAASPAVLSPEAFKNLTSFSSLRPYDKNVDCRFIVTGPPLEIKHTKEGGTVYTVPVADETGSILATFWDEIGAAMKSGDVILMRSGLVTLFKGNLRLACKQGHLHRIDRYNRRYSDALITLFLFRFKMIFKESPNYSEVFWAPNPSNPKELIPIPTQLR